MNTIRNIKYIISLFLSGHWGHIWIGVSRRIYSNELSYGLLHNTENTYPGIYPKISTRIRNLIKEDEKYFRKASTIRPLFKANIPDCYVALNEKNKPVFIQWMFKSSQNDRVASYFKGDFPELSDDEALLEGGYTLPAFRGLGIMPASILGIIDMEKKLFRHTKVLTFVDQNNCASIRGLSKAGFVPHRIREVRWRFLNKKIIFNTFCDEHRQRFHKITEGKSPIPR